MADEQIGLEGFVATGRMIVSGQLRQGDSSAVYSEELVNFFGTQIELMQSAEVQKRAHARVNALHPELEREDVKLEVGQLPKSEIFVLRTIGKSPTYTQAFLDACMDEFIASKKEMRADSSISATVVIQDTLVKLEKDMKNEEDELHEFQKANAIGFLQEQEKKYAQDIATWNQQIASLRTEFESLRPKQNIGASKSRSEVIRGEIEKFQARIKDGEARVLDLANRIATHDKIKSKIERTKSQYDRLVATLRSVDVQKGLDRDTISILERASLPPSALAAVERERAKSEMKRDEKPVAEAAAKPVTDAITRKLNSIIFPKIDFRDSTVREAIAFLANKAKDLDPERQGVNIVLSGATGENDRTRITLTLSNVPLIEVIKYVTNLANLKYKIEPSAVVIVPLGTATEELVVKEWKIPPSMFRHGGTSGQSGAAGADNNVAKNFLEANGVTFGPGAFVTYSPATRTLIVKNTEDQLDLIERVTEFTPSSGATLELPAGGVPGAKSSATPGPIALSLDDAVFGRKTAGLLPVTLDLPKNGRALVFAGLYAPERLVMRYEDWWSRAKQLWLWFVGGGLAFYVFAGRRPCWRTLWAVLVLSAVPLCVSAVWMPVCNALLGGWLAGLVLNRIAAWCVFRARKEVLA